MAGGPGTAYYVGGYTNDHVNHMVAVGVICYQRRQGSRDCQGVRAAQSIATVLTLNWENEHTVSMQTLGFEYYIILFFLNFRTL